MGKLLRGLAIVLLILSGVALWLGIHLFGQREILKGRTQKLETAIINLGPFIENEPAEAQPNTFPAKDISECTSEILDSPGKSEFWASYQLQLEPQDRTTLDIGSRKSELMSYYKIDPVTLNVERDAQGYKVVDGKGTMQNLLNEMTDKAKNQLDRLNQTRKQLTLVREELVNTIGEVNSRKSGLRESLSEIVQLKDKIKQLEEKIAGLEQKIKTLEEEKTALQDRISEQETKITQLDDVIREKDVEIKRLENDIKALKGRGDPNRPGAVVVEKIEPGEKGRVVSVNKEWNFAVIQVTDKLIEEITAKDGGLAQGVNLLVKRANGAGAFVAKVAVMQVNRGEKIAVANILTDWQQQPVQVGDVVFY